MKSKFTLLIYFSCIFNISIIVYELLFTVQILGSLENDGYGVAPENHIYSLIKNESNYISSQISACEKKITQLGSEFMTWILLICISTTFLQSKIRGTIISRLSTKISIIPYGNNVNRRKEINFIVLFCGLCIYSAYGNAFMHMLDMQFDTIYSEIFFYAILFCLILPFFVSLIYNLFRIYGFSFIIACYITFYIKAIGEFFSQEDVDRDEFVKVDISQYSREIQNYLKQQKLENKVYQERNKSDSINAALVGWGEYEHVEIYGEHKDFTNEQFESVLMHEIGHSQDYSLHKKIIVLFVIKAAEFVLMMYLYQKVAPKFINETLSQSGVFIILYIIYEFYMNRYFMVFHKLTSQIAERNADIIAKKHGFGKNLAYVSL